MTSAGRRKAAALRRAGAEMLLAVFKQYGTARREILHSAFGAVSSSAAQPDVQAAYCGLLEELCRCCAPLLDEHSATLQAWLSALPTIALPTAAKQRLQKCVLRLALGGRQPSSPSSPSSSPLPSVLAHALLRMRKLLAHGGLVRPEGGQAAVVAQHESVALAPIQ